jgi:hypothetical protein
MLGLLLAATSLQAQTDEADQAMEAALKDYTAVSGGWYVNQRCWFVNGDGREKFTRDLELINVALLRDLGRAERLREIQRAAQIGANRPPYNDCGPEAEQLVKDTSKHAGLWSDAIRKIVAEMNRAQAAPPAEPPAVATD